MFVPCAARIQISATVTVKDEKGSCYNNGNVTKLGKKSGFSFFVFLLCAFTWMKCLVDIYTVDILPQHKTEFNRVSSSHVWRGVFSNLFTCVKSFTFTDLLLKFKLTVCLHGHCINITPLNAICLIINN